VVFGAWYGCGGDEGNGRLGGYGALVSLVAGTLPPGASQGDLDKKKFVFQF
jgi:hypothetical protein